MDNTELFKKYSNGTQWEGVKVMEESQFELALKERDDFMTCKNCKHNMTVHPESLMAECYLSIDELTGQATIVVSKDFGCIQFESKEEAKNE